MLPEKFGQAIRNAGGGAVAIRTMRLPFPDEPMEPGDTVPGLAGLKEYQGDPDEIVGCGLPGDQTQGANGAIRHRAGIAPRRIAHKHAAAARRCVKVTFGSCSNGAVGVVEVPAPRLTPVIIAAQGAAEEVVGTSGVCRPSTHANAAECFMDTQTVNVEIQRQIETARRRGQRLTAEINAVVRACRESRSTGLGNDLYGQTSAPTRIWGHVEGNR